MADEPFALSTVAPRSEDESDYDAICATVMESARGRWFLDEYARRNRQADTALLLTAINRLENLIQIERAGQGSLAFRAVLLEMGRTISEARGQTAALEPPEARATGDKEHSSGRAEILATAERIQDVAWIMRERGIDPATCQEIETLACSILTTRDGEGGGAQPDDARVGKLRDVLQHLEQRIQGILDACPPAPGSAAGAQEATGDAARLPGAERVPASETLSTESSVADQQISDFVLTNPQTPDGSGEIASSVAPLSGKEPEHVAASLMDVVPSLEAHAGQAVTRSMAELELEPLLPEVAQRRQDELVQPVVDVPPLTVEPLSQSTGTFEPAELSFSEELSALMRMSAPYVPAIGMDPEQIELASPPRMQRPDDSYRRPDAGQAKEDEGTPDGEKETTQLGSSMEVEPPAVELPSSTLTSQVTATAEPTDICADEKTAVEFSSIRGEAPVTTFDQVGSYPADSDTRTDNTSFDVTTGQEAEELLLLPHDENESTPANSSSLAAGEDTQTSRNETVFAAPVPDALDAAQTCPEDADVSFDRSSTEHRSIETALQIPSETVSSDGPRFLCSDEEKSADAAETAADFAPDLSDLGTAMSPPELTFPETDEVSNESEERDEASQSADDPEASQQQSAPSIATRTGELGSASQAIPSEPLGAAVCEEDVAIRTNENELVEPLVGTPIVSTETRTECSSDESVQSEPASKDVLAGHSPAASDSSAIPVNEEPPEAIEAVEPVPETSLGSNTSLVVSPGTATPHEEDGHKLIPIEQPAVTASAASITENDAHIVPAQSAEAPSIEDAVQTGDETLAGAAKERSHTEQSENEASALVADIAIAPDVAHPANLMAENTRSQLDETQSQANNDLQHEAPSITFPTQKASTRVAHDDVLSGAWEEAVLHPEAESAHQARLASKRPPELQASEDLSPIESGTELPLLASEVIGSTAASADTSIDPIQEIEQELFAPSSAEPEKAPAHEAPRVRTTEELLPQPTLTGTSPAPASVVTPTETLPAPPLLIAQDPQKPSVIPSRPIMRSMPRPAPSDPLAALRAMTDEERIALFS